MLTDFRARDEERVGAILRHFFILRHGDPLADDVIEELARSALDAVWPPPCFTADLTSADG